MAESKETFKDRLIKLVEDAETQAPRSVHMALHMTLACWHEGKDAEFAKHCGAFTPMSMRGEKIIEGRPEKPPVVN